MLQVKSKSAGDVVIGGLRFTCCAALYVPSGRYSSEVCPRCYLTALLRERHGDPQTIRAREWVRHAR